MTSKQLTINDYQIGNNVIKSTNISRYLISLWGDESEILWSGSINKNYFKDYKNLRKIFIDKDDCKRIVADEPYKSPFIGCSPRCVIFTNATSKPDDWGEYWNVYEDIRTINEQGQTQHQLNRLEVRWGATKANYQEYSYE